MGALALAAAIVAPAPLGAAAPPELDLPPDPSVTCARCIVVDEEGTVLWARNPRDRYPNASTTKMTTALLVVRKASPGERVAVSSVAGSVGGGGEDLAPGDTYTVEDLLLALLLSSSNEAAVALAEHVGGSEQAFVADMNRFARSLGARRTHFSNSHGLDAEGHYSSAGDLALIGRALLEDPYLARLVRKRRATIETPRGPVTVENRNLLLERYPGAIGIKTGRTLGAGDVLVAAARRRGDTLVAVAMRSYDTFADAAALLDYGFELERRLAQKIVLVDPTETVGALVFDGGGTTRVRPARALEGTVPPPGVPFEIEIVPSEHLELPLAPGDTVGTIQVSGPGSSEVEAVALDAVEAPDGSWIAGALAGLVGAFGGLLEGSAA